MRWSINVHEPQNNLSSTHLRPCHDYNCKLYQLQSIIVPLKSMFNFVESNGNHNNLHICWSIQAHALLASPYMKISHQLIDVMIVLHEEE